MAIRGDDGTHLTRAGALAESLSRVVAIALVASLNVAGWMVIFSGVWRIGIWIVLLTTGIVWVILWDTAGSDDGDRQG